MANPTMTLIGSPITVGSGGASSVTFSSIPATYTDLVVKMSTRSNYATSADTPPIFARFNSDSGANYSSRALTYQDAAGGRSATNPYFVTSAFYAGMSNATGPTANTFNNAEFYVPNYTSSNAKSVSTDAVSENNSSTDYTFCLNLVACLWTGTAAITSITLFCGPTSQYNFVQYSTFYLYGISNS